MPRFPEDPRPPDGKPVGRTLRITRCKSDPGRDVRDEIEFYIEERTHELIDGGMDPETAARQAREAFGDYELIQADCTKIATKRDRRRQWAESVGSYLIDIRYGFRSLAKQPVFTVVACLTLAVCIAANAAVFSMIVTPSFFHVLGAEAAVGRTFTEDEAVSGNGRKVVLSHGLWQQLYAGDESIVGSELILEGNPHTIVGVVEEVAQNDLTESMPTGGYYLSTTQRDTMFTRLAIKTELEARALATPVRERILAIDPEMLPFWTTTMQEAIDESVITRRMPMRLLVVFAAISLFLSAVGICGVLAYTVGQRTREIGVRMALGCPPGRVFRVVIRQGMLAVAIGGLCGLVGTLLLSRLLVGLLYEVGPADPVVLALVSLIIAGVSLLACVVPVRRATRVNPVKALSAE